MEKLEKAYETIENLKNENEKLLELKKQWLDYIKFRVVASADASNHRILTIEYDLTDNIEDDINSICNKIIEEYKKIKCIG